MLTETKNTSKKTNPILWFLFAIVIPIIVTAILAVVIMSFAGVNVGDWVKNTAQKIPVVSSFVTTEEEKDYKAEIEKSEEKLSDQKNEIESLHNNIDDLELTIEQLEQDLLKAENKNKSEENANNKEEAKEKAEEQEQDVQLKQLAASFKKMNKKQAALIFKDLNQDIAISVLQQLSNDVRGDILEAMDPKDAAKLAEQFLES